jgi:hypothetical protein
VINAFHLKEQNGNIWARVMIEPLANRRKPPKAVRLRKEAGFLRFSL